MACYHPLKLFTVGTHKNKNGEIKNTNIIKSYDTEYIKLSNGKKIREYQTIPCGKCIGCRLEYSRQWANRCLLEMQYHPVSYFVTVTYEDRFLPINQLIDPETGTLIKQSPTVSKRDMQLFIKIVRKAYREKEVEKFKRGNPGLEVPSEIGRFRIFACAEYGDKSLRPHMHIIFFGLVLDDLVLLRKSHKGYNLYTSKFLDDRWTETLDNVVYKKGIITVQECTWETCAYTARYIMKKLNGDMAKEYEQNAMDPPFVTMSRRPGIGYAYLANHIDDIREFEYITVGTQSGSKSFRPPRYFNSKLVDIDPDYVYNGKIDTRNFTENQELIKKKLYSQDFLSQLLSEEKILKDRISSLRRNDI